MARVGDYIKIIQVNEPDSPDLSRYNGRSGKITDIDFLGHLHGTWGNCPILPQVDLFIFI